MDLTNPIERKLSAGEYVLGTLTPEERRELGQAATGNAELRYEINVWEQRFAELGLRLAPVAPRPLVWLNLAHATLGAAPAAASPVRTTFWKTWSALATAASLVLAFGLYRELNRPPPTPITVTERVEVPIAAQSLVAVLQVPKSTMAWIVSLTPERMTLSIRAAGQPPATAANKEPQLWWIAESGPVSLGVIPTTGEMRGTLPPGVDYVRGGTIAVSLEPPGGSPEPGPTGPVITTAQMLQAG